MTERRGAAQLSPRRGLQDHPAARRPDLSRSLRLHGALYKGKLLDGCEPHGRAPGIAGEYDPHPMRPVAPQPTQFARGSANHPDGESTF